MKLFLLRLFACFGSVLLFYRVLKLISHYISLSDGFIGGALLVCFFVCLLVFRNRNGGGLHGD